MRAVHTSFICVILFASCASQLLTYANATRGWNGNGGNGNRPRGAFMTRKDKKFALPRVNPAFLGKVGPDSNLVRDTSAVLKYHEKKERRIRELLEKEIGKRPSRERAQSFAEGHFQDMVRKDFSPRAFARWRLYTKAMKKLLRNDKCGPVWNKATNLYYVCCVFRVGSDDNRGFSSCLVPMSIGEIEPSPSEGVSAKFGIQYGFNDVMDSLPADSRAEVQEDFHDMSNINAGIKVLSEEGDFQTELMRIIMNSSDTDSTGTQGDDSEPEDTGEEEMTEELTTTLLDMLVEHERKRLPRDTVDPDTTNPAAKRRYDDGFHSLQTGLANDIKKATSCAAKARKEYQESMEVSNGAVMEYRDEFEAVSQECQDILAAILAKNRENVYELASESAASTSADGSARFVKSEHSLARTASVRQGTTGIWEYDFFGNIWIWIFDYSSSEENDTADLCTDATASLYSMCCDNVLALTPLCYDLLHNAP